MATKSTVSQNSGKSKNISTKTSTNKRQAQSVRGSAAQPKPKKRFISRHPVFTTIVALILAVPIGLGGKAFVQAQLEKSHMTSYLHTKYGKEFVVTKFQVVGAGLGIKGAPVAYGHPKDDNSLRFKIVDQSDNNSYNFVDEYVGAIWAKQETETLKPVLTQIFGYTPKYTVDIHNDYSLNNVLTGNFMNFQEGIKKYPTKIYLDVQITSNESVHDIGKQPYCEQVYKVIHEIQQYGVSTRFGYRGVRSSGSIGLHYDDFKRVQSASDLLTYVEGY